MPKMTVGGFLKKSIDILSVFIFLKIYKRIDLLESTTSYSDLQFLFLAARDGWGSGAIVEIGSYKGKSTAALALGSLCAKREKVFSVDPHSGGTKEIFLKNMARIGIADQVVSLNMTSEEAARAFTSNIRLLFIDGDHEYKSVRTDILSWKNFIIDGGIIAFHDYTHKSVAKAIDELISSSGDFIIEGTVGRTLFASKGQRKNVALSEEIYVFNKLKKVILKV